MRTFIANLRRVGWRLMKKSIATIRVLGGQLFSVKQSRQICNLN
jgi:hypothetical protein